MPVVPAIMFKQGLVPSTTMVSLRFTMERRMLFNRPRSARLAKTCETRGAGLSPRPNTMSAMVGALGSLRNYTLAALLFLNVHAGCKVRSHWHLHHWRAP